MAFGIELKPGSGFGIALAGTITPTPISSDFAASFSIASAVSADNAASYQIQGVVSADAAAVYGVNAGVTTDAAGAFDRLTPTGWSQVTLAALNGNAALRLTSTADLVPGDVVQWDNKGGLVTVFADGTFSAAGSVTSFDFRVWIPGGTGFGSIATQGLSGGVTSAVSQDFTGQFDRLAPPGWGYVNLTTPNANPALRLTSSQDLVAGDQVQWDTQGGLVTVFADGTFSTAASVPSFQFRVWIPGGTGFGSAATQSFAAAVFADQAATFSVFAAAQADTAGTFAVQASASQDGTGTFSLFGSASGDSTGSFAIASAVTQDASFSHSIFASATQDAAGSFSIASTVQTDTAQSFTLFGQATADAGYSYGVGGSVTADFSYSSELGNSAVADFLTSYGVYAAAQADSAGSFSLSAGVTADLQGIYALASEVSSDSVSQFSTFGSASSDQAGSFAIFSGVEQDGAGTFAVQAAVTADAAGAFDLQGSVVSDLAGVFASAGHSTADFAGDFSRLPPTGWAYVDVTTPDANASLRLTGTPDIASGDQIQWDTQGGLVTVYADGTFSCAQSVTSFNFRIWTPGSGFGAQATQSVTSSSSSTAVSQDFAGQFSRLPPTGWGYIDLGTPNANAALRLTSTPDLASGDQVQWDTQGGLVVVYADGTFSANPSVTSFDFRVWTPGSGFGAVATQSVTNAGAAAVQTDFSGAYSLGGAVQADNAGAFSIFGTVQSDQVGTYAIAPTTEVAQADFSGTFSRLPPAGWGYVDVTTPHADPALRLTASPDIAFGDQIQWDTQGGLVTVYADGTFSAAASVASFDFRVWSPGLSWGTVATQTVQPAAGAVSADYAGQFSVQALVQADQAGAFSVYGQAQSDQAGTFSVYGQVTADQAGTFSITSSVEQDASGSFTIIAPAQADFAGAYVVTGEAGIVLSDFAGDYGVHTAAQQDGAGSFGVAAGLLSDQAGSFSIRQAIEADYNGSHAIGGATSSDAAGVFDVYAQVTTDQVGSFGTLADIEIDFLHSWEVRESLFADGSGAYTVVGSVNAGFNYGFIVGIDPNIVLVLKDTRAGVLEQRSRLFELQEQVRLGQLQARVRNATPLN